MQVLSIISAVDPNLHELKSSETRGNCHVEKNQF